MDFINRIWLYFYDNGESCVLKMRRRYSNGEEWESEDGKRWKMVDTSHKSTKGYKK